MCFFSIIHHQKKIVSTAFQNKICYFTRKKLGTSQQVKLQVTFEDTPTNKNNNNKQQNP